MIAQYQPKEKTFVGNRGDDSSGHKENSNMIPENLSRYHILKAIEQIKREGTPRSRRSKKYYLEHEGNAYPPKYIISIANRFANGKELPPEDFSGGAESNNLLTSMGFTIKRYRDIEQSSKVIQGISRKKKIKKYAHSERCQDCKKNIYQLLTKLYREVQSEHKFEIGTLPVDFKGAEYHDQIENIYLTLQKYRGHKNFVKANHIKCDYYLPTVKRIVEFDESQHFTVPRKLSLECYPESMKMGFDKKKWIRLCDAIKAEDNYPPYRDEQRAWYDTLRDCLPSILGFKPTVRLYAKDFRWCGLDANKHSDVRKFERCIRGIQGEVGDTFVRDDSSSIGRIIIKENWDGKPEGARSLLENVYVKWPKDRKVNVIITCGGFIQFKWPVGLGWDEIGDNKNPNKDVIAFLVSEAEKNARYVLRDSLNNRLARIADYITLGIDSFKEKISKAQANIREPHVELVLLVDLKAMKFYWTGKTYPTPGQEHGLVRITDMATHFHYLEGIGQAMILGCHDLTIFNNRNMNKTGKWRKNIKDNFRKIAKTKEPVIVLHHPHTTVTTGTWRNGWSTINKTLQSVIMYAGAGRYFEADREKSEYDPLDKVLERTKKGHVFEYIVRAN